VNYSELKTAAEDYTENTFSATDFATMTKLAEQKIYNAVQLPNLRKTSTLTFSIGVANLNVPTDFLAAYSFAAISNTGVYTFLLNKDVNFIRESYPDPTVTGTPKYYALNGTSTSLVQRFLLGPTPGAALNAELNYFYYPESIVTATNTWLGDNFDSVLLNAVLVEAGRYMKQETDLMAMYEKQFNESLLLLKNLGDGKDRQDMYRSGQVRVKVG
jgi:hypothetical protein